MEPRRVVRQSPLPGEGVTAAVHGLRDAPRVTDAGTRDGRAVNTRTAPPNPPPIRPGWHATGAAAAMFVARIKKRALTRAPLLLCEKITS